jgi:hypothetical protein
MMVRVGGKTLQDNGDKRALAWMRNASKMLGADGRCNNHAQRG